MEPLRRSRTIDEFEVRGVADRLLPYELSQPEPIGHDEEADTALVVKAVTLLRLMPRNQPRERFEKLLSPDPDKGRRAVDALVDAALATVDAQGRLQRTA